MSLGFTGVSFITKTIGKRFLVKRKREKKDE